MTARQLVALARGWSASTANVLRRVIGVPDYDRYLAHVHTHHPGATPLAHEEFVRQRMLEKYTKPGGRCC